MPVDLFAEFVVGQNDYITRHNQNYALIETTLNSLAALVGGITSPTAIAVPTGLQEIFDRQGIIGRDSYGFSEGTLAATAYNLAISAGAYWGNATFLKSAGTVNISMAGKTTGTYYVVLDAAGNPTVSASPGTNTVYSFAYNGSTHVVSAKTLMIDILFDGDDYADMLTSATRSKTFTSVADRLEEIEGLLSETGGFYAQGTHSGLDFYYTAGVVRNDSAFYNTAAGHVTLADNDTNYVEVDPASGTVSVNQTSFTSGKIGLYQVVTASGAITDVDDKRTWAIAGTGGGGGGHTQNTDTGTTSPSFTLNADESGTPSQNGEVIVERGTSPNVSIRWNEAIDKWQYSNDGTVWLNIGEITADVGGQLLTKLVAIENPPTVLVQTARSSSEDFEMLDLSSYIDAPQGAEAVLLQVFFWDSAPGADVNVGFRKAGSAFVPGDGSSSYQAERQPVTILVPVDVGFVAEYFVNASGTNTANLTVWLVGYFAKVIGVGTQENSFSKADIVVAASSTVDTNAVEFIKRGLCHYLKVEETGGLVTGTYDIKIYGKDTFLTADLIYWAAGIDPATDYEDWLPFWIEDADDTNELHVRIINNDASNSGTFTVSLLSEQFA